MIRVSVTTLEQFRRVIETEYASEIELVRRLRGEPTEIRWQMQAGSAWDKALFLTIVDEKFHFATKDIDDARAFIGPGIWQVKATKTFDTYFGDATVVAQADHVNGLVVTDVKAKFSQPDPRDYENDLQWRWYLLIHEAIAFRYVLCDFPSEPQEDGLLPLKGLTSFRCWPYAEMKVDCLNWLDHFLEWADERDLLPYLNRAGTEAATI